jgi:hypothetical protein
MLNHCCERMAEELARAPDDTGAQADAVDVLVAYSLVFDEYGIVVHDGGKSYVRIDFCPWCGTRLPESKRDQWFEALEAMGIDPLSDAVPPAYRSDEWRKKL